MNAEGFSPVVSEEDPSALAGYVTSKIYLQRKLKFHYPRKRFEKFDEMQANDLRNWPKPLHENEVCIKKLHYDRSHSKFKEKSRDSC